MILRTVRFAERARGADLVITGEGRVDETSLAGKAVGEVLRSSPAPVAIVCGSAAVDPGVPFEELAAHDRAPMRHPARALSRAVRTLMTKVARGARR
jgi:glycerate kinase